MATKKLTGFEKLTADELIAFIAKNKDMAFKLHGLGISSSVFNMLRDAQAELDRRAA